MLSYRATLEAPIGTVARVSRWRQRIADIVSAALVPWQTAVTVLIALGLIASVAAFIRLGARGVWAYGIVLDVPLLAAACDRSSRAIAVVPTNWTAFIPVFVAIPVFVFIRQALSRSAS